jgi:hypothetical protein
MISALAALSLASIDTVTPRITAVSMFKNGYSFVSRQTNIASSGEYIVETPPQAAHGTFWHLPSEGIGILRTASTTILKPLDSTVGTLDSLIDLNTGKQIAVDFVDLPSITGKLMRGIGDQLVIKTPEGVVFVSRMRIKRLTFQDEPTFSNATKVEKRVMKMEVEAKNPGTIKTVGLERGLTWVPAYAIDISDPKKLKLVAKATIINELADVEDVDASFITGFPNVRFSHVVDALTNPTSMDQFLGMLVGQSFGGGGMGGAMTQNVAAGRTAEMFDKDDFSGGFIPPATGEQLEDLFFYKLSHISLKKGDRAAYTLFSSEVPFQHLFTWDVVRQPYSYQMERDRNASQIQTVWHSLTFKNESGKPFTTAVASTFQKGQLLGQDLMHYTTPGTEAEVGITKALDIRADAIEEEVSRERAALRLPSSNTYDLITVQGTLTAKNNRSEVAKMRISLSYDGEHVAADGTPKVIKGTKGLGDLNAITALEWRPEVKSGDKLTLNYTYKMYVRTP